LCSIWKSVIFLCAYLCQFPSYYDASLVIFNPLSDDASVRTRHPETRNGIAVSVLHSDCALQDEVISRQHRGAYPDWRGLEEPMHAVVDT
jgi:hypothetical protein